MQQVNREAEWLVTRVATEDGTEDLPAAIEHWILEDFADIVPQAPDL